MSEPCVPAPAPDAARRTALAACIAALLGVPSPGANATAFVTNCNDAGAGSLRAAVASAANGDTVDALGLAGVCSAITLKTGDIVVSQSDLTIKGPGADKLTITAKYDNGMGSTHQYKNRIFTHNGTGTLTVQDVTMSKGYVVSAAGDARGGCVYSKGNVTLTHVDLTSCSTHTTSGSSVGGGAYTKGTLAMHYSSISGCSARGETVAYSGTALAGAAAARSFLASYSSITGNSATNSAANSGLAGAVASGDTLILNSTIANNYSGGDRGGLDVNSGSGGLTLINSTVSGNAARNGSVGGIFADAPTIKIYNSTVAFNTAKTASSSQPPGAVLIASGSSPSLVLDSSIFANNLYGAPPATDSDLFVFGTTAAGHRNLVRTSSSSLPSDTLIGECPLLGVLRPNGGGTLTHALLSHSPAIDAGNNTFGAQFDQRGSPYVRGAQNATPDIGAYEVQYADIVFNNSFDGCPGS